MTGALSWPPTPQQREEAADILRELIGLAEDVEWLNPQQFYATLLFAMAMANRAGFATGMVEDCNDQVVYIDLPSGQVSWAVPPLSLPTVCVSPDDEHHAQRVDDFLRVDS